MVGSQQTICAILIFHESMMKNVLHSTSITIEDSLVALTPRVDDF